MKRSMLIVALLVVLVVPSVAQTTKPATPTSQPAVATTQPTRSLVKICWDIAEVWEEMGELVDTPNWRSVDLAKLMVKLAPLYLEQHQREFEIREKLDQKMRERVNEAYAILDELDKTPTLTPTEEKEFEKWFSEGKEKSDKKK